MSITSQYAFSIAFDQQMASHKACKINNKDNEYGTEVKITKLLSTKIRFFKMDINFVICDFLTT